MVYFSMQARKASIISYFFPSAGTKTTNGRSDPRNGPGAGTACLVAHARADEFPSLEEVFVGKPSSETSPSSSQLSVSARDKTKRSNDIEEQNTFKKGVCVHITDTDLHVCTQKKEEKKAARVC